MGPLVKTTQLSFASSVTFLCEVRTAVLPHNKTANTGLHSSGLQGV